MSPQDLFQAGNDQNPIPNDWDRPLWDRLPGEPAKHYRKLLTYLAEGPSRSLYGAYLVFKKKGTVKGKGRHPPGSWRNPYKRWAWRQRAEAYDVAQAQKDLVKYEDARAEEREKRIMLLKGFRNQLILALDKMNLGKKRAKQPSLAVFTYALKMVTEQLRIENDQEPAQRVTLDGKVDSHVYLSWDDGEPVNGNGQQNGGE